ncbi:unnamed protein product [Rotaria sp. Silwood2]|nr:unnamed protein product [Rotaria sp. Silwood2]CAF4613201.1 unnamed protein product [Rotaria sp. Silwood2]
MEGILHNGVVITSPVEIYDIAKQFYTEQFSEHENNQSVVEIEAYVVDQELDKELKNLILDCSVLFIAFYYDILKAVSNLHFKHPFADDFANVLSP